MHQLNKINHVFTSVSNNTTFIVTVSFYGNRIQKSGTSKIHDSCSTESLVLTVLSACMECLGLHQKIDLQSDGF